MDEIAIKAPGVARSEEILTPEALRFPAALHRRFDDRRLALLEQRRVRQVDFHRGLLPDFPAETADSGYRSGGLKGRADPPPTCGTGG